MHDGQRHEEPRAAGYLRVFQRPERLKLLAGKYARKLAQILLALGAGLLPDALSARGDDRLDLLGIKRMVYLGGSASG